jgi:hypothetical protein
MMLAANQAIQFAARSKIERNRFIAGVNRFGKIFPRPLPVLCVETLFFTGMAIADFVILIECLLYNQCSIPRLHSFQTVDPIDLLHHITIKGKL